MAVYLLAELSIHDRDEYGRYEAGFLEIFARHGGEMLAVDEQPEVLEGESPWTRTVLIRFADREAALGWYRSDDYQALMRHRLAASDGNVILVKGLG